MAYLHDIHPTITLSSFPLRFPITHAEILTSFRAHLRSIPRPEPSAANPKPKVIAVIDAIISNPGALLPWEEMVQICREEDVVSVVDAAHAIGQQVGITLSESKPDFWISVSAPGCLCGREH
jgi:selenocysteine lyase/cysteine desulfurase